MNQSTPCENRTISHSAAIALSAGGIHLALAGVLILVTPAIAQGEQPALQPLLGKTNFTYLGAFALPQAQLGGSSFNYGGHAITPYHDPTTVTETLFLEGHAWYPGQVAQVRIPSEFAMSGNSSSLPMAQVLQPFHDITDGQMDTAGNYTTFVYGMLPYNGRLVVAVSEYYDADGSQVNTHGVSGFELSDDTDFTGFHQFDAVASPRSLGGYMTTIPIEWRELFGGPALSGQSCLSIISNGSSGPAATVFDPDDVAVRDPIPGITVLYYPLSHPLAQGDTQNPWFNLATQIVGIAFPPGSRSVLFIGRHGTGPYCYGTGEECDDPADSSKGTHAYPYQHQVWAYDAIELVSVKERLREPWEIRPYATWTLDDLDTSGNARMTGAGYDPLTGRLYIAQAYGDYPRIDVFRLTVPVDTAPVLEAIPDGDGALRVILTAAPGIVFAIQASSDLVDWTTVVSGPTDSAGQLDYLEIEPWTMACRFYRSVMVSNSLP